MASGSHSRDSTTTILLSKFSKKACTTLGDEELCRVYHEDFFAWYAQCAWSAGNVLYHSCTSFQGASRGGQPLGSVLAQMAFPLHASEISIKSETGRGKHVSIPAESSHFFPFKKGLYRRGQNVTFFGKDVTKNVTS